VTSALHRTALHDMHLDAGAVLTEFAGWDMPLRYGSTIAEHHAVRRAAGLFDLSHMAEIEVSGDGAAAALDYALTGTPSAIDVGRARYSMLCAEDGGVLDDLVVYRLAATTFWVVANAGNAATVVAALTQRASGFAADVTDASGAWSLLAVQGPASARILTDLCPESGIDDLRYYSITSEHIADISVRIARTGYTGEDGFELFCSNDDATALWNLLDAAGAPLGLVPAGLGARDTLRLEAGMPLYGHELSLDVTPFDAGLGRVVHLGKTGDFVGRAALERAAAQTPHRVLVGLAGRPPRSPRADQSILDPATGDRIGTITSGAPSPTLEHPIAMGYVAAEHSPPGTDLIVDVRGHDVPVQVVPLPFYTRP